jgi:hypothetical protein
VSVFHERRLPETATPAGYAALIDRYDLKVPLPRTLAAIGLRHKVYESDRWRLYTPRHTPHASLEGHLTFALKYEGLDLAVLKHLFMATGPEAIAALVKDKPTGSYARRLWFLYEWLLGEQLDLPDAGTGSYVKIVDPEQQWDVTGETVSRQRIKNNLPGVVQFCPLVFKTEELNQFVAQDYAARAQEVVSRVPKDVLARTAAFLLLKDSKSSYAIEGERAPQDRIQRWGRAIGEAGRNKLDDYELLRLQKMVIGDTRFVHLGLRIESGFVGERERHTRMPLPDHISARHEDLPALVEGLLAFDQMTKRELDAVIAAAILAFGFVYMHPFEDGNGRIHRYLIHHALSIRGFNPPGVVFPVSAVILANIEDYRRVLEDYSQRLLPLVEWEPTEKFNVRVLNDTKDFYSYFDATPHAEFLYRCVKQTIEEDLPQEADFLRRYDEFCNQVQTIADMPDSLMDLLFRFLQQNDGRLSQRARTKEFSALSEEEVVKVEKIYEEGFRSDTN